MPEWLDALQNEEMSGNESLSQIPDVATLAKGYLDAQSHIGGSIRIPSENASDADRAAFNEKLKAKVPSLMNRPDLDNAEQMQQVFEMLGRPAEATGYEIEADEGLLGAFHAQGLTKKQAAGMSAHFKEVGIKDQGTQDAKIKEGMTGLAEEWGYAFDQRLATAVATLKKTGAPEALLNAAETGKVGADTLRWAYAMGNALGAENPAFANDGKGGGNQQMTPSEAMSQIRDIQGNKDHAYWNRADPSNKAAIDQMVKLQKAAHAK